MTDRDKRQEVNEQEYIDRQLKKDRLAQKDIAQAEKDRSDPRLLVPSDERIRASHGAQKPSDTMKEAPEKGLAKTEREQKMDRIAMKPSDVMKNSRDGEDQRRSQKPSDMMQDQTNKKSRGR